jgi:hypothetical protein
MISVTLKGTYAKVLTFLDKVTSFTRVVRINSVSFTADKSSESASGAPNSFASSANNSADGSDANKQNKTEKPPERNLVTADVKFYVYFQKLNKDPGSDALKLPASAAPLANAEGTESSPTSVENPAEKSSEAETPTEGMSAKPLEPVGE